LCIDVVLAVIDSLWCGLVVLQLRRC